MKTVKLCIIAMVAVTGILVCELLFALATICAVILPSARYLRWLLLDRIAKDRFVLGRVSTTKRLADELLDRAQQYPDDWNYGNAIHHGNILHGRVLLRAGDVSSARQCLLNAGQTLGSPQLNSFGPSMSLARDLLERGQSDVVLSYLTLCRSFWKCDFGQLDRWETDITSGKTPDFRPNLIY
jgi:hypothetical protein